jgi:hypothetical protein
MYYLSFDIATKTLAYCLFNIDYEKLNNNDINCITLKYGMADLLNGKNDNSISTTQRIKLAADYVRTVIIPLIKDINELTVLVEYQMPHNQKARIISNSIISILYFINPLCKIIILDSKLKNTVYLSEEGRYYNFVEKYNDSYTANKKHTIFNFKIVLNTLNSIGYNFSIADKAISHVADAFFQMIGYIKSPDKERMLNMY